MKKGLLFVACFLLLLEIDAQVISQFDFDDPGFDERIATVGPNASSSGTIANARATGNGTPQGCAAGVTPFGSGGCFTAAGCPQAINMVVSNAGNIFNVGSPTMSIDYRRPVREIDGWFWIKDQLAFGVRFSKLTARYSHDNGMGGCIPTVEFAAYPPAWEWATNGLWTWGGAAPSNGEIPPDGIWRTVGFSYNQTTGVASITISNPAHTQYSYGVAGMAFCGWTTANMSMFPNMDNGATGFTNNTAFLDNARYGNMTVLPVVLEYFRADQNGLGVDLNWKTTAEQQNMGFILYRSSDAENWTELARVDGNLTTTDGSSYTYRDNTPFRGENYYRLIQVDMDGATAGFPSIHVNVQYEGSNLLALSPNPVTEGMLQLTYDSQSGQAPVTVQIQNMAGQTVHSVTLEANSGINLFQLDVQHLASGMYLARLSDGKSAYSKKFSVVAGN